MVYTEIKERNRIRYFYRCLSLRKGSEIAKKRIYLGKNLPLNILQLKESEADRALLKEKINKTMKKLAKIIIRVLKKNNVKKAGIFGSYARGEQKKHSDIDIIIEPPKGIGYGFVTIALDLEKSLHKKVDLITYNSINPHIKKYITKDEVRLL